MIVDAATFALLTGLVAVATIVTVVAIARGAAPMKMAGRLAYGLYLYTLVVSSAALAITAARALGVAVPRAVSGLPFQVLIYRGWLVVGAGVGAVAMIVIRALTRVRPPATRDAVSAFVTSPYLRKALCLSVALSFVAVEIGKLAHDGDMRQFFLQSGYAVWFLYAVMALELLGAAGLLIPPTTIPAAAGLSLLMIGAIATHYRNGDPFTDSLEALHLLVILACIIVIVSTTRRAQVQGRPKT